MDQFSLGSELPSLMGKEARLLGKVQHISTNGQHLKICTPDLRTIFVHLPQPFPHSAGGVLDLRGTVIGHRTIQSTGYHYITDQTAPLFLEFDVESKKKTEDRSFRKKMFTHDYDLKNYKKKKNNKAETHLTAGHFDNESPIQHSCGSLNIKCVACAALHFTGEITDGDKNIFSNCCQKGAVHIDTYPEANYPKLLEQLLTYEHPSSKNFHNYIRNYNSSLAFASIVSDLKQPPGRGPFTFRISGQMYHYLGPLTPEPNEHPAYGQLYFLDTTEANNYRANHPANQELNHELLNLLDDLLRSVNPFAKAYTTMRDSVSNHPGKLHEYTLIFDNDRRLKDRRHNAPAVNEVAAIIIGDLNGQIPRHSLVVQTKERSLRKIPTINADCDPLCYPLLFPFGTKGWHPGMKKLRGVQSITMLEHYQYRLATRSGFNPILSAGTLFQQYVVDAYVKIEGNRLQYQADHQSVLRAETYKGLADHLSQSALNKNMIPGKVIILSSSFVGSPRSMQQSYQDAMAICRKFGKPTFFITMTCNPKWEEITSNLSNSHQSSYDRPDLTCRVFRIKYRTLIDDLMKKHVLGKVVAYVFVIEFQKRGLPHCHILIIVNPADERLILENIDDYVCCEIPDSDQFPRLYEAVKSHMVHGPCGDLNPNSPCMTEEAKSVCSKNYPKDFRNDTDVRGDGYPLYRRRDLGRTVLVRGKKLDNRWIVPFNPYFLLKYDCHINVEICATVKSFKYLYKYIFKGHDCARVRMVPLDASPVLDHDEIKSFIESRYISPPEAFWRISEFEIQEKSHTITRLPVHLENEQELIFHAENPEQAITSATKVLESAKNKKTMLTAWFELNKKDLKAHTIIYPDIPTYYVFDKKTTSWKQRQKGGENVIGRMYTVTPADVERFHLRLLLLHSPGATSYNQLLTINGTKALTFHQAARMKGLIADDSEWRKCLEEACYSNMPYAIRQLFAIIIVYGSPLDIPTLWHDFKQYMIEDFLQQTNHEEAEQLAYYDIEDKLKALGTSFTKWITPPSRPDQMQTDELNNRATFRTSNGQTMYSQLTNDQKIIADKILHAVIHQQEEGVCYFIDGPGGTGKTFLYTTLTHLLKEQNMKVINVAWTGITANLLPDGATVHSTFKLPLILNERSTLDLKHTSKEAISIKEAAIIIWDEAPMASRTALEIINKGLQDLMRNPKPFGGKIMLLGGDFRQVLPVVTHGPREKQVAASIKRSPIWNYFQSFRLNTNIRADKDQKVFTEWLLNVGNGTMNNESGEIQLPPETIIYDNLIQSTFGAAISTDDPQQLSNRVILTPTNEKTLHLNDEIVKLLPGQSITYKSIDTIQCDNGEDPTEFPDEFLNSLTPNGLPPHLLTLKNGTILSLLRNLNTKGGLCNGTRLQLKTMFPHLLDCLILTGKCTGQRVLIPRIQLEPSGEFLPFKFWRKQFPVRIGFAMTINKAQGQTFETVGLDLTESVFSHGQLYVALSRVRNMKSLRILLPPNQTSTKNVVYNEILN